MKKILILLLVTLFSTQVIGAEAHDASSAVNNKSVCLTGGHAQVDGVPSLHDYENLGEAVAAMNRSDLKKWGILFFISTTITLLLCNFKEGCLLCAIQSPFAIGMIMCGAEFYQILFSVDDPAFSSLEGLGIILILVATVTIYGIILQALGVIKENRFSLS